MFKRLTNKESLDNPITYIVILILTYGFMNHMLYDWYVEVETFVLNIVM